MIELLKKLCSLPGVSGNEGPVREVILAEIGPYCSAGVDALGNIIAHKKGADKPKNKLMLSAHMDEVGFIITYIENDGLLRFAAVGGIDGRVVVGKSVRVGIKGLYGVIGVKAVHLSEKKEIDTPPKMEDLYIDIGAGNREEALLHTEPGDTAVFNSTFAVFGDGLMKGRALDDRLGCALLISLIKKDLPWDCAFVFSVQEETGCIGGGTAAFAVNPDIGIVVETTTAADIPDVPMDRQVSRLGGGPAVSFMDRRTVYPHSLYRLALDAAQQAGIPCQPKGGVSGGNEAGVIQTARAGTRVMAVSVPCRYLHSPCCVASRQDIEATAQLLELLVDRVANV